MKPTALNQLVEKYDTFLLDASGVIYSDYGPFEGTVDTIKKMQENGTVFVVTNNSFQYLDNISSKLKEKDIHIPPHHIISSGLGLSLSKEIHDIVANKIIYVYGSENSHLYVQDAGAKDITPDITQADVVVMTASYKGCNENQVEELKKEKLNRPTLPIVCCNPDKVVLSKRGIKPVVGHYAQIIEELTGSNIHWVGKPFENFSGVVKQILDRHHPSFNPETTCFFDDNIENVMRLKRDLSISGCWVKGTGIFKDDSSETLISRYGQPDYLIPVLSI
jgi:HAD superfamily hydrolase (TIGR01459 family)